MFNKLRVKTERDFSELPIYILQEHKKKKLKKKNEISILFSNYLCSLTIPLIFYNLLILEYFILTEAKKKRDDTILLKPDS